MCFLSCLETKLSLDSIMSGTWHGTCQNINLYKKLPGTGANADCQEVCPNKMPIVQQEQGDSKCKPKTLTDETIVNNVLVTRILNA